MAEAPQGNPDQKTAEQKEFEDKRRIFFAKIGVRYKDLIALHKEAGQVSRSEDFGVDEYGKEKRWGDPTQHCLVEAAGSEILGDLIGLSEQDKATFAKAAILHDYRKKGEIEEGRGVTDPEVIEQIYAKTKNGLRAHGIDDEIVDLTEAVAHTSLPEFAELDADNNIVLKEVSPLRMAMHYIDDVTLGTNIVNFDERIDGLLARQHLYPYNEEGRAVWGGRTFFEAQREVGHLVQDKLAGLAGISDPTKLPDAINEQLYAQINAVNIGAQA